MGPIRRLDKTQQFFAILKKNFILQTRGRKSLLGIGGWAGLLLQLLLPVAFFFVMYLPKHYIKPTHHGETLGASSIRLESRSWADPYDGPATFPSHGGRAHLLLAPDTPDVRGLAAVLARSLACPRDPALRVCPVFNLPTNFHCMFMPPRGSPPPLLLTEDAAAKEPAAAYGGSGAALTVEQLVKREGEGQLMQRWWLRRRQLRSAEPSRGAAARAGGTGEAARVGGGSAGLVEDPCANFTTCISTPACYEHVLQNQIAFAASQEAARQAVKQDPNEVDAVVFFPGAVPKAAQTARATDRSDSWDFSDPHSEPSLQQSPRRGLVDLSPETGASLQSGGAVGAPEAPGGAGDPAGLLGRAVIGMNHSDVPPTGLLLDLFEVVPTRGNGLALYRMYWFFANLQLAINRAVIGVHLAASQQGASAAAGARSGLHVAASDAGNAAASGADAILMPSDAGHTRGGRPSGDLLGAPYDTAVPANVEVSYKPFPWPSVTEDLGAASAAIFFNLLLVYAFLPPTRAVVGDIVREKELRLREGMRVLGLSEPSYWLSWGLTHWLLLALSGALCTAAGTYPFANSSTAIMLLFFWLYAAALVSYSYCLSTLFTSSRVAGTATQLLYAVSMLPGFVLPAIYQYGSWSWYAACLSPPSAASLFAAALVNWEKVAEGITPRTLWVPITQANGFSAGTVLMFLAADVVLFAALTWYLDKVLPKSYGQRLPWWFILDRRYWSARRGKSKRYGSGNGGSSSESRGPLLASAGVPVGAGDVYADGDAEGLGPAAVEVHGLVKTFRTLTGGTKVAVDHLDMRIERGRITALLGHNGAGKTTTIHVLTGMLQPTDGSALVNGFDVATQMDQVRASLGICPQFDILWPDLTVYEHLALYGSIKGYPRHELKTVATAAAAGVGLTPKLHAAAGELSGGQRRKLSVAIAFMGDPAVVFLDEPTSGMDPYSRRFTWDVIRQHRSSSAIVLTTHSMEEADLLGDRVIILARGRVAAEGTGMELKAAYGVGYNLTLVMDSRQHQQQQQQQPEPLIATSALKAGNPASGPPADGEPAAAVAVPAPSADVAAAVMAVVQKHVPSAELLSAAGAEVVVRLPREAARSFPGLLRDLDGPVGRSQLGVASYGLSLTTLEEVFLSITAAVDQQAADADTSSAAATIALASPEPPGSGGRAESSEPPQPASTTAFGVPAPPLLPASGSPGAPQPPARSPAPAAPSPPLPPPLHGWRLYGQQLRALLAKRALCARRDRLAVVTQLLVPLALVYLALWISSLQVREPSEKPLELSRGVALFGRPLVVSASPAARNASEGCGGGGCLAAFLGGHPGGGAAVDSGATALFTGDQRVRPSTLEAFLLSHWYRGPIYDAIHVTGLPPPAGFASAAAGGPAAAAAAPALSFVLLTNQSAVSALPAALSDAMSAALSYIHAGIQPQAAPQAAASVMAAQLPQAEIIVPYGSARRALVNDPTALKTSVEESGEAYSGRAATAAATFSLSSASGEATGETREGEVLLAAGAGSSSASAGARQPAGFSAVSWPLPTLVSEPVVRVQRDAASLMLVLCLVLASSVLSASFVVFLVREQDINSKHLQLVSGAPATAYWLSNYVWDLLSYSASAGGLLALIAAYQLPQYTGKRLAASAGLLWGFGPAGISLTYLLHFLFRDEMRALQRLNTAYFLSGYLGFVVTWICDLIELLVPRPGALHRWNAAAKWALRTASPHYCFARGMYDVQSTYDSGFPFGKRGKPFDWDVYGSPMAHMAAQTLVYGGLAVLYDMGIFTVAYARMQDAAWAAAAGLGRWRQRLRRGRGTSVEGDPLLQLERGERPDFHRAGGGPARQPGATWSGGPHSVWNRSDAEALVAGEGEDEDDDVREERLAVEAGLRNFSQVLLYGVKKSYSQGLFRPAVAAVRGLWVGVPSGECFGLLGVNGAGKTTTFRMLTGEVLPDAGDARVGGCSVRTMLAAARRQLGYCPQFEALPGAMTGREVAAMYARLRGVPESHVGPLVAHLLKRLGLQAAADSPCGGYSGGMKRKLGVAVALVGDPRVCALDEPSTGMDPGARRGLWECLQSEVIRAGRTVVLTSHSMEECEALCTRLTIMVAGRLKCLGTVQHLKTRFGGGYVLEIKTIPRSVSMLSVPAAAVTASLPAQTQPPAAAEAPPAATAPPYSDAASRLTQWLASVCPGATLKQADQNRFTFSIPRLAVTAAGTTDGPSDRPSAGSGGGARSDLAALFEAVEAQRTSLGVVDYCLTQTTLEQVFVAMAQGAEAEATAVAAGAQHGQHVQLT